LIEDLRSKSFSRDGAAKESETNLLREQLIGAFAEWIHISTHPNFTEKMANAYIVQVIMSRYKVAIQKLIHT
jgi:hypothetical protein